jgi:hypothetical protein
MTQEQLRDSNRQAMDDPATQAAQGEEEQADDSGDSVGVR